MVRRIVAAVLIVGLLVVVYYAYKQHQEQVQASGGNFKCIGCMTPEEKARFERVNAGETADGQSEHKIRTARADDAAGFPEGSNSAGGPAQGTQNQGQNQGVQTPGAQNQAVQTQGTSAPTAQTPGAGGPMSQAYGGQSGAQGRYAAAPAGMPASDTVSANPPNGMAFGGKGNYQWYRQGNVTWRLDTLTGRSCIVFATLEEWQKGVVYSHGCGRNA